jgi:hypothetical protein
MKTHIRRAGMGKWTIALAFALWIGTPAFHATPAPDTTISTQQVRQNRGYFMKGKFLDIVQGDDLIFVLLDQNGKRRAFYVSETFPRAELAPFSWTPASKASPSRSPGARWTASSRPQAPTARWMK